MIDWLKKNVVDYKSSVLVSPDISGTKRFLFAVKVLVFKTFFYFKSKYDFKMI